MYMYGSTILLMTMCQTCSSALTLYLQVSYIAGMRVKSWLSYHEALNLDVIIGPGSRHQ